MNLVQLLEDNQRRFGTYESLVYEGRVYTNAELAALSSQLAHHIQALGVRPGDAVMVTMPNRPEVVIAFYAIAKAGAVAVPVMPLLQASEVRYIIQDSNPKLVITCEVLKPKIQQAIQDLSNPPVVRSVDDAGVEGFETVLSHYPAERPNVQVEDHQPAVILYTSGTTGKPKGVILTHHNLCANARAAADLAEQYVLKVEKRVGLGILPLSHAFGFTMMNTALCLGELDVLLPYFDPVLVFQAIERYRVTHFTAVPAMFHALLHHPDADKYDLSSLSVCISGSAPLPELVRKAFEEKFHCLVFQGYGLSEAAPVVTAPRFDKPAKPGSVGLPLPGVEVAVLDDDGNPLPPGEIGELAVRGPNVSPGYHHLPEETEKVFRNGWLFTGDMARLDEEGYVYIVDRKKDVIIRGGFNIYPSDLEELLSQHPAVAEVAVVGAPSERMGEEVVAYVVRKKGADVTEEELIAFCQEHLAKYKTPKVVQFVPYLPKNLIGKVDKKKLREMAKTIQFA
ncbi:long-chain-fatty-acid--CoA ligase [Alicyclobacillus acidocaldarius]|uniref:AMP-dependent synthetase and ligase n=1 Tax=Alicyclobacillus acidocaldarius subsp. acidocaldarius (strain ATCC 27009 / DSM 446 / BCRC 14685 / JCM 5260 / KCTC 1825 / NBRC 15652 / NCIMB 11725 / NRRL B-14509 / 104-IA) TaxID=521098 RepID=C8WQM8_ALIAD|nr:long-chain fatty acid--CoA ligase [Alicyclobacillus acidocaldarius]ACV57206.1 AMP-dependent synthetase and ligase [Alicyclobacillus acidocaldarius subsp. acidocaldarius DSM 446]